MEWGVGSWSEGGDLLCWDLVSAICIFSAMGTEGEFLLRIWCGRGAENVDIRVIGSRFGT